MPIDPKKVLASPIYFVEEVIGMKLTNYQKEWLTMIGEKRRICLMAFRSSGKTRQLFVHYFLWNALVHDETQYLIVSKTLPQAIEILKDIRLTILTNPFLKSMVPDNRTTTWSRTELELKNHSRILSKAATENIRGLHVDGVGVDELGLWDNHSILTDVVLPTIRAKRGFFVGTGTPKSTLDLLHKIRSDPSFKSIHFEEYPAEGEKGPLFELRYPDIKIQHSPSGVDILDKKSGKVIESYSNMTWTQEFLLKPLSMQDSLFPSVLIDACLDPTEKFSEELIHMKQYFIGADFAMSAQAASDYTVVTVLEKGINSPKLTIKNIYRWRGMDYALQKQKIKEICEIYKPTKVLGDEGSFGKVFIYDLLAEGIPIEGYKIAYTNRSKEELIKTLRDQFDKQGFVIPFSPHCPETQQNVRELVKELTQFGIIFDAKKGYVTFEGQGHDDLVISLALANFIARHVSMACFKVVKGSQQGKGSPFIVKRA